MAEKLWFIKRCNLFETLRPEQLAKLESRARLRSYPKNSSIYLPSDASDGVLLLAEGRVRLCNFTGDGKQAVLAFIEPGEIFGEFALFEQGQREERAETIAPSTVVLLPSDLLEEVMRESPNLSLGITKLIGLRRQRIERRLKSLLFRSNRQRLVHLLLELAEQYGRRDGEGLLIALKLSHQDLANIIGSTRETVTVQLGELQLDGALKVSRQRILIRDLRRLTAGTEVAIPSALKQFDAQSFSRRPRI